MNIFVTLVKLYTFKQVTYYSLQIEGEDSDMFLGFINEHFEKFEDCIRVIQRWLKVIGNKYGAQERFFDPRVLEEEMQEHYLLTLTASKRFEPEYFDINCNLRLYCMRVSINVVILFSGAEKTAATAQLCDNVRTHFLLANRITPVIDELIRENEIDFDKNGDLLYDENLIIEIK